MKLPFSLEDASVKGIFLPKKRARVPNVYCIHCGFEWHDARFKESGKLPLFCIECYKRTVAQKPSFSESVVLSARAILKKRQKQAKRKSRLK